MAKKKDQSSEITDVMMGKTKLEQEMDFLETKNNQLRDDVAIKDKNYKR